MTKRKDGKAKGSSDVKDTERFGGIATMSDLKTFLHTVLDKMSDEVAAPIYAVTAINHVMNLPNIHELLDSEAKELARDIWLRLKASGMQLRNPPILFGVDESFGLDGIEKKIDQVATK